MRALRTYVLLTAALAAGPARAHAQRPELPSSLAAEALAEAVPTAFAPAEFTVADFAVERTAGDAAISAALQPESLRWVRVGPQTVVPRALLRVHAAAASGGGVAYEGFSHPLVADGAGARADVPVVLLAGTDRVRVRARLGRDKGFVDAEFAVRFAPRPAQRGRVLFDSSCSPFGLRVASGAPAADSWLYVGCRLVRSSRAEDTAATLELYVLWDGATQLAIDGVTAAPAVDAVWTLRVGAAPGRVRLAAGPHAIVLGYALPDPLHAAFVGLGLGPYLYAYRDGAIDLETTLPMVTLYAGYAFTPDTRLVYFNATAIHPRWGSIDQGLYVWLEQARFVDDRVSLNLLLGANLLVYSHDDHAVARVSVPQGFEFIVRDLFARNRSLTLGAFLYPKIAGSAYYNAWLRWGSPQLFGELNYIEWEEPHGDQRTKSRALGVSFGAPVLRFF